MKMEEHNSVIQPTIEKGSLVLVTGVTGYIASQTVNQLLEAGYRVRGTVRDLEKAQWLYKLFDEKYGKDKFHAVVVADMMAPGAFDEAVQGVDGIVHMASVMSFSNKIDEVIPPTVKGALNILTSATKEPRVKSIVYTSSSTAALLPQPNKVINIREDTWNDETIEAANNSSDPDGFTIYGASKTEAEKAVWKAVNETNPPFQVAAVSQTAHSNPFHSKIRKAGILANPLYLHFRYSQT